MTKRRADTLVTFYCTVLGENDDLLGVDETPITKIYWSAIDVKENEVRSYLYLCQSTLNTYQL